MPIRETIRRSRLAEALEESVRLQSHYAKLLNAYDGGQRITFSDAQAWLDRLQAIRIGAAVTRNKGGKLKC